MTLRRSLHCLSLAGVLLPGLLRAEGTPSIGGGPDGPLAFEMALALALERDPDLAAAELELRAGAARRRQAGLRPNPEASFEVENLSGDLRGASSAEATFALAHRFELGGKRGARVALIESLMSLGRWDRAVIRRDLVREVSIAFAVGLGAQERLRIAEETLALAREVTASVERKVRAGAISPVEVTRARGAVAVERIEVERARRELEAARRHLALSWRSTAPRFTSLSGALDTLTAVPDWASLVDGLRHNPDVARWEDEALARGARLGVERSLRIPDLIASGGYRRLAETDQGTFVASIGLPLPLLARNQGAVAEATIQLERAPLEAASVRRHGERALIDALARIEIAQVTVRTLRAEVIPLAGSSYEEIDRGYNLGKLTYLDLLEARRSLAEARSAEIDALVDIERARAEVASLVGGQPE